MILAIIMAFLFELGIMHAASLDEINLLMKNKQMSLYGVKNPDQKSSNGIGLFYNKENIKLKIEESDTAFKSAAMVKIYPLALPMYLNIGANYIDQNIRGNNELTNNVNQYSTALAVGYMLHNNLYVELGGSVSELNGYQSSLDNQSDSHTTKDIYMQIGKRFDTPIGTVDTAFNSSQIYKTLSIKEENYETNFNYYLDDKTNLGYFYRMHQNEIYSGYSINLSYFMSEYRQNFSQDNYNFLVGMKANFTDITKLSTYKPPKKRNNHLSKSHKFDTIVLDDNMRLRK